MFNILLLRSSWVCLLLGTVLRIIDEEWFKVHRPKSACLNCCSLYFGLCLEAIHLRARNVFQIRVTFCESLLAQDKPAEPTCSQFTIAFHVCSLEFIFTSFLYYSANRIAGQLSLEIKDSCTAGAHELCDEFAKGNLQKRLNEEYCDWWRIDALIRDSALLEWLTSIEV